MKAVYPEHWRGRITDIVHKYAGSLTDNQHTQPDPQTSQKHIGIGKAYHTVRRAQEVLTGEAHRLVWVVDLVSDLGEPDMLNDPNGYEDCRWTDLLDRMWQHLQKEYGVPHSEWHGDDVDCLNLIVSCTYDGKYGPQRIAVGTPHQIDVERLTSRPPPVGHWAIVSHKSLEDMGAGLPVGWFRDQIPF